MNLIKTLRRMAADAEAGRWASMAPNKDAEDREAIETVRAMQEALGDMLTTFHDAGCHICGGDCSAANPPVICCPSDVLRNAKEALRRAGADNA